MGLCQLETNFSNEIRYIHKKSLTIHLNIFGMKAKSRFEGKS